MPNILISDTDETHALGVLAAISNGYGSDVTADTIVRLNYGVATDLEYAAANHIKLVVASLGGVHGYTDEALTAYASGVQLVMPLGSNTHEELTDLAEVPIIVTTGAGTTENETAYGPGLEFWDDDPITPEPNDSSSFSNGVIAGKLLAIYDGRGIDWWDARYAARQTATGGGTRTDANGYGQINTANAISYSGPVPGNPYYSTYDPEEDAMATSAAMKVLVDALTTDPASEPSLVSHAAHHDVIHTAMQELYDYKRYVALVSQSGTDSPTAEVLENTFDGTPVWSRIVEGEYYCTLSGAWTNFKTACWVGTMNTTSLRLYTFGRESSIFLRLEQYDLAGQHVDGFARLPVMVLVYD